MDSILAQTFTEWELLLVDDGSKDNTLDIVIKDRGVGIEDTEQARKPMFTTGGAERSGMGFTIMESFMSSFTLSSVPGRGTTVHMRRKIQRRK